MVVVALVQVDLVLADHRRLEGLGRAGPLVVPHVDPAVGPFESPRLGLVRPARELDAVGVAGREAHLRGGGEQAVRGPFAARILELDGARVVGAVGPLDDVDDVGARFVVWPPE